MTVNAVRVPMIEILIQDFGTMTVSTSVVVNQAVTINAQSSMAANAVAVRQPQILIAETSGMSIAGVLKWATESDTPETWSSIPDQSEIWTAVSDASTSWAPQSDTPEPWTPISENSETWQIAA
jgi:cysteine synthase